MLQMEKLKVVPSRPLQIHKQYIVKHKTSKNGTPKILSKLHDAP